MKITVIRNRYTDKSTIGEMYIDGKLLCNTLEDKVRTFKIPKITAIDSGTYKVELTMSNRFKEVMPILLGVPNFTGIRIHRGNTDKNTEGCILVGLKRGNDIIYDSRKAFDKLMEILKDEKHIEIQIVDTIEICGGI